MSSFRHLSNIANVHRQIARSFMLRNPTSPQHLSMPISAELIKMGYTKEVPENVFLQHQRNMENTCDSLYLEPPKLGMKDNEQYLSLFHRNKDNSQMLLTKVNNHIDFDGMFSKCRVTDLFKRYKLTPVQFLKWLYHDGLEHKYLFSENNIGVFTIPGERKITVFTTNQKTSNTLTDREFNELNVFEKDDIIFDVKKYDAINFVPMMSRLVQFVYNSTPLSY